MKTTALISFVLLLSPLSLAAQTTGYGVAGMEGLSTSQASVPTSASQVVASGMPMGCPVSLRARQGNSGGMVQANRNRPKGVAQLLHLTLIDPNPNAERIVSARLRVSGLSGNARATQTLSAAGKADSFQTLEARFSSGTEKQVTGDLWVPAMTAVLSIDLDTVIYADGSKRNFSRRDACRVVPDPLMLIAGE